MMTKALIGLIVVLLALLGWARYDGLQAREEASRYLALTQAQKAALEASEGALRRSQAAATRRAQAEKVLKRKLKASNDALSQALKANPAWSDEPVPPAVADWLREH